MMRRQTTVIGSLVVVMAGLVAVSLLVWTGALPIKGPGFAQAEETVAYTPPPCPPEGATTVDLASLTINVYNGSETVGLASNVEEVLTDAGLTVVTAADWPQGEYKGNVQIMASEAGLAGAYSMTQIFPDSTVQIDTTLEPADPTVSVVLGDEYAHTVLPADEIQLLGSGQAIAAPDNCVAASSAAKEG
ncbi:LytR C-terminal domain-containing protein [Actinomyces bowdenii]|uniref:LytR family transcriptional regulator n=2 Tax=Actinomyces bowdenii TaxID=131109 RepID=A0A3P1V5W0_9ACTO|nr:LytR C-terminal domain-containing protein [Actinomyces bowdenii]MBO3723621.1 LytR C-terminal domain-containing protein [Actinomyces bowdenii]RRD29077.1 LytR family transcriptional regulator [Actinomyces bowdenii]